jgi:hypothetical protein
LDADQIHRKSTIPVLLEIFSIQLGEGQSWTPIHTRVRSDISRRSFSTSAA